MAELGPVATAGRSWHRREAQPYEKGNFAALKHGATSPRLVEQRAQDILAELQEEGCAWLTSVDALQLDTWLKARARYEMLDKWVTETAERKGWDAISKTSLSALIAQERNLMRLTQDLGLDPTGRARLLADLGLAKQFARQGARDLAARGREIRQARGA